MTADLVPVGSLEQADTSFVDAINKVILLADDQRQALAEAGDWNSLAWAFKQLKEVQAQFRILSQSVESDLARTLPGKKTEITHLGVLEVRQSKARTSWDWPALLDAAVRRELDPEGTGEVLSLSPVETAELITNLVIRIAPLTASQNARVTALRDLGLDVGDFCSEAPGKIGVQIHG